MPLPSYPHLEHNGRSELARKQCNGKEANSFVLMQALYLTEPIVKLVVIVRGCPFGSLFNANSKLIFAASLCARPEAVKLRTQLIDELHGLLLG